MKSARQMQLFTSWIGTILLCLTFFLGCVNTTSSPFPPLQHTSLVTSSSLQVVPNAPTTAREHYDFLHLKSAPKVTHDSTLRLTLTFDSRSVNLHLIPNKDIIHPQGIKHTYTGNNGEPTVRTIPREKLPMVFRGEVVEEEMSERIYMYHTQVGVVDKMDGKGMVNIDVVSVRDDTYGIGWSLLPRSILEATTTRTRSSIVSNLMNSPSSLSCATSSGVLGKARITVINPGTRSYSGSATFLNPTVVGAFSICGETFNISQADMYDIMRTNRDVQIPQSEFSKSHRDADWDRIMLVHKDSDRYESSERTIRGRAKLGKGLTLTENHACGSSKLKQNYGPDPFGKPHRNDIDQLIASLPAKTSINPNAHVDFQQLAKRQFIEVASPNQPIDREPGSGSQPCPSDLQFLYIGVAYDCTYFRLHQNSEQRVLERIIDNFNRVSELYQSSFNVGVGVQSLEPKTECGGEAWNRECDNSFDIEDRLSTFSEWRGTRNSDESLWHLLSTCATGNTVGLAWMNVVCQTDAVRQNNQFVSGTGVSAGQVDEWKVIAHELGHNLGAYHDCNDEACQCRGTNAQCQCCACGDGCDCENRFVMNPTSNFGNAEFSDCTRRDICSTLRQAQCLGEPGSQDTIQSNVCGNGIREAGEECDCGSNCEDDDCCTDDCTLAPGAVCDDRHQKCCSGCQIRSAGEVCRPSLGECDPEEACDGSDAACPEDVRRENGESCGNSDELYCASGLCTSRDQQCRERGQQMNLSAACESTHSTCELVCRGDSPNVCTPIPGYFQDGTECGFGGQCSEGECINPDFFTMVGAWIAQNPDLTAVIGAIIGLLLLCCVGRAVWGCVVRKRHGKARRKRQVDTGASGRSGNAGATRQPNAPSRSNTIETLSRVNNALRSTPVPGPVPRTQEHFVDPLAYNGYPDHYSINRGGTPTQPPPTYARSQTNASIATTESVRRLWEEQNRALAQGASVPGMDPQTLSREAGFHNRVAPQTRSETQDSVRSHGYQASTYNNTSAGNGYAPSVHSSQYPGSHHTSDIHPLPPIPTTNPPDYSATTTDHQSATNQSGFLGRVWPNQTRRDVRTSREPLLDGNNGK